MNFMQNHIGAGDLALMERARQSLRAHRLGAGYLLCIAAGILSANASVLDGLAPFGVAFAAAAKQKYLPAAALGAAVGYMLSFRQMSNIRYLAAMTILFLLRWGLSSGMLTQWIRLPGETACALSLGIPSLAILFLTGGSVYDLALALAEVLLCACACYFFRRTIQAFDLGLANLRQTDITSVVITFCIVIIALLRVTVAGLSVGRILAVAAILLAAQVAREAGGAIAGVAAGVSAGVLSGANSFLMGTYGFGGLLAGVFAPMGRFASAGAFILVNSFALLASRNFLNQGILFEIFIASAASVLLPGGWVKKLVKQQKQPGGVESDTYRSLLNRRIGSISGALRDVADTTRKVNEKLSGLGSGDIASVYHTAADRICRRCKSNAVCWQLRYTDTCDALNHAMDTLRARGQLAQEDFPERFAASCIKLPELTSQMNRLFSEYTAQENLRRKVARVRGVVTDQFEGMALMVDAMGRELGGLAAQDDTAAQQVREYMRTLTVFPDKVSCTIDQDANMLLEMVLPAYKLARLDLTELTVSLSDICGRDFDLPVKKSEGASVTLCFYEKAAYAIKWGATQLGNQGARLCGDSYSYVDGAGGRVNIILSDGMGSGGAAAVDSTMTAELLKRLIEAGVSLDAALKLVNSALLVKSGEESLATIDITGLDLYTGRVEFYKAGAAPTFLRKSGKGGYVESRSLPVGILNGVSFEKNAVTLREGDWVVMVSDGAVTSGYEWIVSDLEHYNGSDPKQLSELLALEAKRRRSDGHEDDITVIAILLEQGI